MIIERFCSQGNRIKNSYPASAFSAARQSAGAIDSSTCNRTALLVLWLFWAFFGTGYSRVSA